MIKIKNLEFYLPSEYDNIVRFTEDRHIPYIRYEDTHPKFQETYFLHLESGINYYIIKRKQEVIPIDYWFTSDLHLGHKRVLKYDPRPWDHILDHDLQIRANIIEVVKPGDQLYILGDTFFYKDLKVAEAWIEKVPGQKFFIKGNHDYKETIELYEKYGTYLGEQKRINILGDDIVLNHFPMRTWNRSHYGAYHLYGHHHGDIDINPYGRSMDVWIGTKNYYPLNWIKDIKPILSHREIHYVQDDHHNALTNP